jgi:hypothetical protein
MSQCLSFDLVNRADHNIKVDLGYWSTSIARGISWNFEGIFPFTECNTKMDMDTLKSYIETLHEGIDEYRENLRKEQESKKENTELLLKAQSAAAVEAIKEDISSNDDSIADWQDEIDTWSMVENKLNFILDMLKENEEEWELYYRNS